MWYLFSSNGKIETYKHLDNSWIFLENWNFNKAKKFILNPNCSNRTDLPWECDLEIKIVCMFRAFYDRAGIVLKMTETVVVVELSYVFHYTKYIIMKKLNAMIS